MMENSTLEQVIEQLEKYIEGKEPPIVTQLAERKVSPFVLLISTLLSARTKDEVTEAAVKRLFARASNPEEILALPIEELEKLIYPVGFYRTKARNLHRACAEIINRFHGDVPDNLEGLLSLAGVGRKTANLVLALAFGKDAICVDTHVHRITNRLGIVKTRNPEETELKLREILPQKHWQRINTLLVKFGQDICRPLSPLCRRCPIRVYCRQVGIKGFR